MFLYNRTSAYDAIVERMKKHEEQEAEGDAAGDSLNSTDSAHTTQTESTSRVNVRQRKATKTTTSPRDSEEGEKPFAPHDDNPEGNGEAMTTKRS